MCEFVNRRVVAVDVITRDVVGNYDDYKAAAKALGVTNCAALKQCSNHSMAHSGGIYIRFEDEFDPDEVFVKSTGVPIYATDGKRLRVFLNTKAASEACSIAENTLCHYARVGSGAGLEWGRLTKGLRALVDELEERCRRSTSSASAGQ